MTLALASEHVGDLEQDGFCVVDEVLSPAQRHDLIEVLSQTAPAQARRGDATYGARNLLANDRIKRLAWSADVQTIAAKFAGAPVRPVRALFFDKTHDANWLVPWHQDVVVAVAERRDLDGWGPWTIKAGVPHVEAPVEVLSRMVTLRLHIDDCGADNGPLRVLPRSHLLGRLKNDDIRRLCHEIVPRVCLASEGSALAMRPLLVHGSSSALRPRHRRVLHLEYASADLLPPQLGWAN